MSKYQIIDQKNSRDGHDANNRSPARRVPTLRRRDQLAMSLERRDETAKEEQKHARILARRVTRNQVGDSG